MGSDDSGEGNANVSSLPAPAHDKGAVVGEAFLWLGSERDQIPRTPLNLGSSTEGSLLEGTFSAFTCLPQEILWMLGNQGALQYAGSCKSTRR